MTATTHSNLNGSGLREVSGAELESVDGGAFWAVFSAMAAVDQATGGEVFKSIDKVVQEYKDSKGGKK